MPRKKSSSSSSPTDAAALICPACARGYPSTERFCARCGMPLVFRGDAGAEEPASEARERARKIRPEYTRGELVRVAGGRNQAEAELIQNILLEEGVPSVLRRTAGFDVPDYLAAGPRDVLVAESAAGAAHEILRDAELAAEPRPEDPADTRRRTAYVLLGLLGGGGTAAFVAWLLIERAA